MQFKIKAKRERERKIFTCKIRVKVTFCGRCYIQVTFPLASIQNSLPTATPLCTPQLMFSKLPKISLQNGFLSQIFHYKMFHFSLSRFKVLLYQALLDKIYLQVTTNDISTYNKIEIIR